MIKFIILLIAYFLPNYFLSSDSSFYHEIIKPDYAPPAIAFSIVWPIIFIFLSIFFARKWNKMNRSLIFSFIINYFLIASFGLTFFILKNLYASMVITILTFISTLLLFFDTKEKEKYLLLPLLLWTFFASILSISIYLLN